jgi:NAD+ synthase (glutamine-hydrolysing)
MRSLRLGMAQMNPTVGDLEGNVQKIREFIDEARNLGVDLLSFPELALTGYPPEDLLLKPSFISDNLRRLREVVEYSTGITVVLGFVDTGENIHNAAAVIHDGRIAGTYHKTFLPNYGVFDEDRYFQPGKEYPVFVIHGVVVGVNICEDIWYPAGPTAHQVRAGAEVIVNIDASPYDTGKRRFLEKMLGTRASDHVVVISYNNQVGGQDELVFGGQSFLIDERGEIIAQGKPFAEDLIVADLDIDRVWRSRLHDPRIRKERRRGGEPASPRIVVSETPPSTPKPLLPPRQIEVLEAEAEVYAALVLGTGDYVRKNGFRKVVLGLSGGIDSALVATIAVDALGKENVIGVSMPSAYSSPGSRTDARKLARNLGIELRQIPIENAVRAYAHMLAPSFQGTEPGVAEENIQARIRGNILMALSNKFGWLVLSTGNKSEMATGYSTLYGDMAGGFAVLKDVPKTLIFRLCRYRNSVAGRYLIPRSVLEKPPSAELRPDQKDIDTLPPYEVLDPILEAYVEQDRSLSDIVALGFDEEIVRRVISMVDRNEYKRRQAPPGIKITPRAFGKDRRLPITSRYLSL